MVSWWCDTLTQVGRLLFRSERFESKSSYLQFCRAKLRLPRAVAALQLELCPKNLPSYLETAAISCITVQALPKTSTVAQSTCQIRKIFCVSRRFHHDRTKCTNPEKLLFIFKQEKQGNGCEEVLMRSTSCSQNPSIPPWRPASSKRGAQVLLQERRKPQPASLMKRVLRRMVRSIPEKCFSSSIH